MRTLFGLVVPDGGTVRWRGRRIDSRSWRRFGYMPEERGLYPGMRVGEQIAYFGRISGLSTRDAAAAGLPAESSICLKVSCAGGGRLAWPGFPDECRNLPPRRPGTVVIEWRPCDCPAARAARGGTSNWLCGTPGCVEVWQRPGVACGTGWPPPRSRAAGDPRPCPRKPSGRTRVDDNADTHGRTSVQTTTGSPGNRCAGAADLRHHESFRLYSLPVPGGAQARDRVTKCRPLPAGSEKPSGAPGSMSMTK
jgi:ABC-type sugar transport system ATPase subunit